MKKLSKLMCLLLAVGMLMGIASCSSDAGEGGGGSSGGTETVRISCGPLNGYQNVLDRKASCRERVCQYV